MSEKSFRNSLSIFSFLPRRHNVIPEGSYITPRQKTEWLLNTHFDETSKAIHFPCFISAFLHSIPEKRWKNLDLHLFLDMDTHLSPRSIS